MGMAWVHPLVGLGWVGSRWVVLATVVGWAGFIDTVTCWVQ